MKTEISRLQFGEASHRGLDERSEDERSEEVEVGVTRSTGGSRGDEVSTNGVRRWKSE